MRVLLVDDEPNIRVQLAAFLEGLGFGSLAVGSGEEAVAAAAAGSYGVALVDLRLPGIDGLETARRLLAGDPECHVILMTAYGSVETAVEALKAGVYDFLVKPVRAQQLEPKLRLIAGKLRAESEVAGLRAIVRERYRFDRLVGQSAAMQAVFAQLASAALSDLPVLLSGETGTGKEVAARAIHFNGPRRESPFVALNCGALPDTLMEAELFGHVRGAFTGAERERPGRIAAAAGGTLFLDELGAAPENLQVKLLRFLEEKRYTPVGADQSLAVDVRVLAASNTPPEEAVAQRTLRQDLFYRLNVVRIELPPLRSRREDIPLLVHSYLSQRCNDRPPPVDPGLVDALITWPWVGNVRELQNVIDAALLAGGKELRLDDVPARLRPGGPAVVLPALSAAGDEVRLDVVLAAAERGHIERVLAAADGRVAEAARRLGVTERGLRRKMERLAIDRVAGGGGTGAPRGRGRGKGRREAE